MEGASRPPAVASPPAADRDLPAVSYATRDRLHLAGATFVEIPGDDHLAWSGDTASLLRPIRRLGADLSR